MRPTGIFVFASCAILLAGCATQGQGYPPSDVGAMQAETPGPSSTREAGTQVPAAPAVQTGAINIREVATGSAVEIRIAPLDIPLEWKTARVDAQLEGIPINRPDTAACIDWIRVELLKYPEPALRRILRSVTLLSRMSINGRAFGGYADDADVYIVVTNRQRQVYDRQLVATVLHHEISSVFWRSHNSVFPAAQWSQTNPQGFQYAGWSALKSSEALIVTPELKEQGFLIGYGRVGVEDDFNSFCELLFTGDPGLWRDQRYSRIAQKTALSISFWSSIDKSLNEEFFRSLVAKGHP